MITERTFQYIKFAWLLGQRFCFHPYVWNEYLNVPELSRSKLRLFLWRLNAGIIIGYHGFVTYQCIRLHLSSTAGIAVKIYMQFNVVLYVLPVLFQLTIIFGLIELPRFVRGSLKFGETMKGNANPGTDLKLMKYFETFSVIWHYAVWADVVAFMPLAFLFPTSPEQLSSALGLPAEDLGLMQKLANTIFWTYYLTGYAANVRMCVSAAFLCFFIVLEILEGLGRENSPFGRKLNHPEALFQVYTALFVQVREMCAIYAVLFPGAKFLLALWAVFCTCGAIRLQGFLSAALTVFGIVSTTFLGILMTLFAEVNDRSIKLIRMLRTGCARNAGSGVHAGVWMWYIKKLRAMQPIKVNIGPFYYADKPLVLGVIQYISEGIVFILFNS